MLRKFRIENKSSTINSTTISNEYNSLLGVPVGCSDGLADGSSLHLRSP